MSNRVLSILSVLGLVLTLFTGCFKLTVPEFTQVRNELEEQVPEARFEKEIELGLGRITLGAAKWVCLLVPDAREASKYLNEITGVSIAVYEVDSLLPVDDLELPKRLQRLLEEKGWDVLVKVREEGEIVWVLYQEHREHIRNLYVVALEDDELVLVRLRGRLDRLFAKALEEESGSEVISALALD
jgi:hypothetical protein